MPEFILTYVLVKFAAVRTPKLNGLQQKHLFLVFVMNQRLPFFLCWLYFQCFLILCEEVALIRDMISGASGKITRVGRNVMPLKTSAWVWPSVTSHILLAQQTIWPIDNAVGK